MRARAERGRIHLTNQRAEQYDTRRQSNRLAAPDPMVHETIPDRLPRRGPCCLRPPS